MTSYCLNSCISPSLCFFFQLAAKNQQAQRNQTHSPLFGNSICAKILLMQTWGTAFSNEIHSWMLWSAGGGKNPWSVGKHFRVLYWIYFLATPVSSMHKCFLYYQGKSDLWSANGKQDINLTGPFGVSTKWQTSGKQLKASPSAIKALQFWVFSSNHVVYWWETSSDNDLWKTPFWPSEGNSFL